MTNQTHGDRCSPAITESTLVARQIAGDRDALHDAADSPATASSVELLVVAAILRGCTDPLDRAGALAQSTRDRQLVVLALAWMAGDRDRFGVLVRDHLVEFPDSVVASWIASRSP